ncbi:hypothetical protein [Mesorhizobium sp. M0767]|uniref:hypothetical protein n=1 Tax=unclassified Mesorhizobium TaxID=325217 RepID=UPI003338F472
MQKQKKGERTLVTPYGRRVNAFVFGRSYQEIEKSAFGSVEAALDGNDPGWRERELIVMPSHARGIQAVGGGDDIDEMIHAAHGAGFDIVCAAVAFGGNFTTRRTIYAGIWSKQWDERWTIPNPERPDFEGSSMRLAGICGFGYPESSLSRSRAHICVSNRLRT